VRSRWSIADGRWTHDVTVPPNTKARVTVPAAKPDDVAEGGKPLAGNPHVRLLQSDARRAVLEVDSGVYRFTSSLPSGDRQP
jgi:alpha-L-rhamnosidase